MKLLLSKILNSIKWRILNLWSYLVRAKNQFFNFYLTNLFALYQKRILIENRVPKCNQKLLISGKGKFIIGDKCVFGYKLGGNFHFGLIEIQPRYLNAVIEIGSNVITNNNLLICCANRVTIGKDSLIGNGVTILDHEAHNIEPSKRREIGEIGTVSIGENTWIGNNVLILKNTIIGDNTIVAAGAIVSGIFPENVIIGGIPAKIIRNIDGTI